MLIETFVGGTLRKEAYVITDAIVALTCPRNDVSLVKRGSPVDPHWRYQGCVFMVSLL